MHVKTVLYGSARLRGEGNDSMDCRRSTQGRTSAAKEPGQPNQPDTSEGGGIRKIKSDGGGSGGSLTGRPPRQQQSLTSPQNLGGSGPARRSSLCKTRLPVTEVQGRRESTYDGMLINDDGNKNNEGNADEDD